MASTRPLKELLEEQAKETTGSQKLGRDSFLASARMGGSGQSSPVKKEETNGGAPTTEVVEDAVPIATTNNQEQNARTQEEEGQKDGGETTSSSSYKPFQEMFPEPLNIPAGLWSAFPAGMVPLMELRDAWQVREDSVLSLKDREIISAYTSFLNNCEYCHGAHVTLALKFGMDPELLQSVVGPTPLIPKADGFTEPDVTATAVANGFRIGDLTAEGTQHLLTFCRVLTFRPQDLKLIAKISEDMASAGVSLNVIHEASCIVGIFNMFNRLAASHGVVTGITEDSFEKLKAQAPTEEKDFDRHFYVNGGKKFGFVPQDYKPMNHKNTGSEYPPQQ